MLSSNEEKTFRFITLCCRGKSLECGTLTGMPYRLSATASRKAVAGAGVSCPCKGSGGDTSVPLSGRASSSLSWSDALCAMLCRTQAPNTVSTACGIVRTSMCRRRRKRPFSNPKAPSITTRCPLWALLKACMCGCHLPVACL